jgi:hypothetical protein
MIERIAVNVNCQQRIAELVICGRSSIAASKRVMRPARNAVEHRVSHTLGFGGKPKQGGVFP